MPNGTINGDGTDETIPGTSGDDIVCAGDGNDRILTGTGRDEQYGEAGDDTLVIEDTGSYQPGEVYDGGSGYDTLEIVAYDYYDLRGLTLNSIEAVRFTNTGGHQVHLGWEQFSADGIAFDATFINGGTTSQTFFQIYGDGSDVDISGFTLVGFDARFAGPAIRGTAAGESLIGSHGQDSIDGGAGDDRIDGGTGDDFLVGGEGDDTFIAGAGQDFYAGGFGIDTIDFSAELAGGLYDMEGMLAGGREPFRPRYIGDGVEEIIFDMENLLTGQGDSTVIGNVADNVITSQDGIDVLDGAGGDDALAAGGGNDQLRGGAGSDTLDGGEGTDTARLDDAAAIVRTDAGDLYIAERGGTFDTLVSIEVLEIGARTLAAGDIVTFDALSYAASSDDLARTLSTDAAAALQHFLSGGALSGREDRFDAAQYLANYSDLQAAFPTGAGAVRHFLEYGLAEVRLAENPLAYIASFEDLIDAFAGLTASDLRSSALAHYAANGQDEGRRALIDFEAEDYVANYADLTGAFAVGEEVDVDAAALHFIRHGRDEGRLTGDAFSYAASHQDLAAAWSDLSQAELIAAATSHYASFGRGEGRSHDTFDELTYILNYDDLQEAFVRPDGSYDLDAATLHFVQSGFDEGRTDDPLL